MGKKVTIAAGYIEDEALKFLREHGARIDTALGLSMIELPEDAEICEPGCQCPPSEYAIQWTDEEGNEPDVWIEVEHCFNVADTTVKLGRTVQEPEDPEYSHWNGRQWLKGDNLLRPSIYEREG